MPVPRIPGIPGASEPHFRTGDRRWMGLDTLVMETCDRMEERGMPMSPMAVKATVQTARQLVDARPDLKGAALVAEVSRLLRPRHVLAPPAYVHAALLSYTLLMSELDVQEINDFLP